MSHATVTALTITAVKGTRVRTVQEIQLEQTGAVGDRRFFLIDARDRMVNGKQLGQLHQVMADFDAATGHLSLTLPGEQRVSGSVEELEPVEVRFYSGVMTGRLAGGPFAEALSELVAQPVRLASTDSAIDRGRAGAASLISRASLQRLAQGAGVEAVDARRFRMLIEIDGVEAHAEDRWVGRSVRVGAAVIGFEGHVGRCLVTSRGPETGEIDLPTLDILREYRGEEESTEPLPFGIHGSVLQPGRIVVGDPVAPV